ncbi:helix-turn-helix transcriptional regulator [Amycolatopsis sp. K13G38]|uniref:Helix-turn-helix transcriptional regulator n=2 Tax=Amycolatopsis acididurans TaxID=2724524 RepID=A0ABX1J8Z5_9PSEU|nr:helix-turn-helix transcriptional regulator [Amycolatopsis acididurans]
MAAPLGDYHRIGLARSALAMAELAAGHVDNAAAALSPMLRLVESADTPPFVPGLSRAMGYLRLAQDRLDDALRWFGRESDLFGDLAPQTLLGLVTARRLSGDSVDAAQLCERALEAGRRLGMPKVIGDALEESAFLAGERAGDLHHEALAIRAEHGLWPDCVRSLEALAALGSEVEAARLSAACARARQEMGLPHTPADSGEERVLELREAIEYARRARGKRGRPSSGWASLTPAEQSVVRLAAEGLSNPEIGSRLYMSRSTVKTHLSHVYAKLGVTNRTELAAVAKRTE